MSNRDDADRIVAGALPSSSAFPVSVQAESDIADAAAMPQPRYSGAFTALLTPFCKDGIDERQFRHHLLWQLRKGCQGFVPCSLFGEAPTLSIGEQERLIRICVEVADGRVPVIAGTGTNCTATTIARTRDAKAAGANAALIVTPYYNKPSQEGLYRHFEAVARAVDMPIFLHNLPSHTGVDLSSATVGRLAGLQAIVGIVDGSTDQQRFAAVTDNVGPDFVQLCWGDTNALSYAMMGGTGCVSLLGNIRPSLCAGLQTACRDGRYGSAQWLQEQSLELLAACDSDNIVSSAKYALSLIRPDFSPATRLPLVSVSAATAHRIDTVLQGTAGAASSTPTTHACVGA